MRTLLLAVGLSFVAGLAAADEAARWDAVAARLAERPEATSLRARFVQEKFTPLLAEPIRSTGVVRSADGLSRWDTETPHASVMLMGDGELRLYYPEAQTLEVYALDDGVMALSAAASPDVATLRERFELTQLQPGDGDVLRLILLPRGGSLAEAVEEVVVELAAGGGLRSMTITDADGETTATVFDNVELNPGIERAELELELPAGTRVVRPLAGVGAG
ncbi:MAG: outer membrane lipoprotein carrier protein LolA [Planctomycetota bacterium]